MLQKLRPKDSPTDILFVGTERFEYFTAAWDDEKDRLVTTQRFEDLGAKHMRDSQSQDKCVVDPTGKFMAMHLWEGVLNVVKVPGRKNANRQLEWLEQVRLTELMIRSSIFLHSETGYPKIAFLYQGKPDVPDSHLAVYRLTADDKHTKAAKFDPSKDREISMRNFESAATFLIPVEKVEEEKRHNFRNPQTAKAYLGGLIVVGETSLVYVDCLTKCTVESALREATIFVAWACYDIEHYFLADDYGQLYMLKIQVQSVEVIGMTVTKLGKISRASCLVYLGEGYLYVASHQGTPQLIHVSNPTAGGKITIIDTFANIAPILDFAIMDLGNRGDTSQTINEFSSGQARIVAGCGVWDDGVLNSIRSGVGLEDLGILAELEGVRGLFSVKISTPKPIDALIISFPTETRAFTFETNGEVEEVDTFCGLSLESHTILIRQLPDERLLQVTPKSVIVLDTESSVQVSTWSPPEGTITNASANNKWLLIALGGKKLLSLSLTGGLSVISDKEWTPSTSDDQVACVHMPPQFEDIAVVGNWAGVVSIVEVSTLTPRRSQSLQQGDSTSVPRDIVLVRILPEYPSLFVAMSDGLVVSFSVSEDDFSLHNRKSVVLGTRHSQFYLLPNPDNKTFKIFSTSEHPSLIYGSESRVVFSAVNAENTVAICPFNIPAFPGSIALATDAVVKICLVEPKKRTHVKAVEIKEIVRRVAYSSKDQVFGIGCIKRELKHGEETIASSFRLVDEVVFENIGKPFPLDDSPATEMVETVIRAELTDSYGNPAERFLLGTSYVDADDTVRTNPVNGRILVLGVDSERNPYLIAQQKLKGSCRRLCTMNGKIVAGLGKVVAVYSYTEETTVSGKLEKIASYRPSTAPVDMAIHQNTIAVGDLMKSITLVEFVSNREGSPPNTLSERARHLQSAWTTSVAYVGDSNWLLSDANGNLITLRQNIEGATADDRRRMDITSEFNLGEMVNRTRELEVDASPNAIVVPKAFIGTVEGGMYLFGKIAQGSVDLLLRFQENLAREIDTLGGIELSRYRAFRNEEREADKPFRFVDGEFMEKFLDMDEELQAKVCAGLGPSVESMRDRKSVV